MPANVMKAMKQPMKRPAKADSLTSQAAKTLLQLMREKHQYHKTIQKATAAWQSSLAAHNKHMKKLAAKSKKDAAKCARPTASTIRRWLRASRWE